MTYPLATFVPEQPASVRCIASEPPWPSQGPESSVLPCRLTEIGKQATILMWICSHAPELLDNFSENAVATKKDLKRTEPNLINDIAKM